MGHTWKKPMSPPGVHFVACVGAPNIWAFLRSFARRRPNFWAFLRSFVRLCPIFWAFLRSYARRPLKNWISVGDRITGIFPCMLRGGSKLNYRGGGDGSTKVYFVNVPSFQFIL